MNLLILLSLPFGLLGYGRPSWWVLLVPYALWAGFAVLESIGVLPGTSSLMAIVLAGTLGAICALLGVLIGRTRRPRGATHLSMTNGVDKSD